MSAGQDPAKAFFLEVGAPETKKVEVHFNPATLQYTRSSSIGEKGKGTKSKQFVGTRSAKLSMELLFDTTDTGTDVRIETQKIELYMSPADKTKTPPVVQFSWGAYKFTGMIESYREKVDFFSSNGVPLRASVSISMAVQDTPLERTVGGVTADTNQALDPAVLPVGAASSAAQASAAAGDARAAREVGAVNRQPSLRFGSGAEIAIPEEARRGAAAAFTTAEQRASEVLDAVGGPAGRLSRGIAASEGAFSRLRKGSAGIRRRALDAERLVAKGAALAAELGGGDFQVGGRVRGGGSGSIRADVGAAADLFDRIRFEDA